MGKRSYPVDLIVIEGALSVRSIESSGLDSADCCNTRNIVVRGGYVKKIWLMSLVVLVVSISVTQMYPNALAEIRTMKIKVTSCLCTDMIEVRSTVQRIEGVKAISTNPINKSAIITFDDEKTNFEQIKDSLVRERVHVLGQPEYLK
jgi:copper chaperone CopZ